MRLFLLLMLVAFNAHARDVQFSWTAPTARADGSLLVGDELSHYVIDINGTQSQVNGTVYVADIPHSQNNTVRVSAVDVFGLQGEFTDPLLFDVVPANAPGKPTAVTVTPL